jgi:hypothetical protein
MPGIAQIRSNTNSMKPTRNFAQPFGLAAGGGEEGGVLCALDISSFCLL